MIVVGNRNGVPIYVRNLGKVAFAPRIRQGAVTRDGKGETVVRRGDDADRRKLARGGRSGQGENRRNRADACPRG